MKLIKNHILYLISGAALMLGGCVDDSIIDKTQKVPEGDTPYYVKLKLKPSNATFTRSGDDDPWGQTSPGSGFESGTNTKVLENAISTGGNFAIFFDADEKYIACANLYSVNEYTPEQPGDDGGADDSQGGDDGSDIVDGDGNGDGGETGNGDGDSSASSEDEIRDGSPEAYYTTRFYGFADREPKYVLVVVNAPDHVKNKVTDFPGWTLDEVRKQIWEESGQYKTNTDPLNNLGFRWENGKQYFAMTNSVYLDYNPNYNPNDPENNTQLVVHKAEEIPSNAITTKEEEVRDLKGVVTVPLERMVSKFTLSTPNQNALYLPYNTDALDVCRYIRDADDSGDIGTFVYTPYKWAVQVLGWGINGYERQNYLFKNINPTAEYFGWDKQDDPWGWNQRLNKRCYWSEDPHYTKDQATYPWQYRDAKDKNNNTQGEDLSAFRCYFDEKNGTKAENFALTYYPFTRYFSDLDENGALLNSNGEKVFDKNGDMVKTDFVYNQNSNVHYSPENTYQPGIIVDRHRASRAYELAGTHLLLCSQLRIDLTNDNNYNHVPENIYRNRVGVSYINELDMFEDFMNAVNFKLTSQKYLYYNYSPWEEVKDERTVAAGQVMRAVVGGSYALYYHYEDMDDYDENGNPIDEYRELTYNNLLNIHNWDENKGDFIMTVEAAALNGDGKVMPWICYKKPTDEIPRELELLILCKDNPDALPGRYPTPGTTYNPNNSAIGEVISLTGLKGKSLESVEEYINARRINFQQSDPNYTANTQDETDGWRPLGYMQENGVDKTDENGKKIHERNANDLKSVFFEIWGVADHFNHGLMYYAVPIAAVDRNGKGVNTDENELDQNIQFTSDVIKPDKNSDDYNKFYGYHGVVRNNWYNFTLRSINDIGIPVSDQTQPIVPNYHKKLDQTKVEMEILQWHMEDIIIDLPKKN